MSTYLRGALLIAASTVLFSIAGLLARWVGTDPPTTLFWRSVFAVVALGLYLAARKRGRLAATFRRLGGAGLGMAVCFATSSITFIFALPLTTVAAVLFFQAAAPVFAAAMAWALFGERIGRVHLFAIAASLLGVGVMVGGAPGGGLLGALLPTIMTVSFAASIVLARAAPDVPATAAVCTALALIAAVTAPFATLAPSGRELAVLALFGVVQMGGGLILFTAGVVLIPSADAGVISILETVLAPLWVWLAFGEEPGASTLAGGGIVVAAVGAVAWWGRTQDRAAVQIPAMAGSGQPARGQPGQS